MATTSKLERLLRCIQFLPLTDGKSALGGIYTMEACLLFFVEFSTKCYFSLSKITNTIS